jgi:hypothetical protein
MSASGKNLEPYRSGNDGSSDLLHTSLEDLGNLEKGKPKYDQFAGKKSTYVASKVDESKFTEEERAYADKMSKVIEKHGHTDFENEEDINSEVRDKRSRVDAYQSQPNHQDECDQVIYAPKKASSDQLQSQKPSENTKRNENLGSALKFEDLPSWSNLTE